MNVSLTPKLEAMIRKKVRSGLYHSASEVVREGLRLLDERDRLRRVQLDELRRQMELGLAQADRGEVSPLDAEELKAEARRRRRSKL